MINFDVVWGLEDDPESNVRHIAENGLSKDDVEDVLFNPDNPETISRTTGNPITFGETRNGLYIAVVWETALKDPLTINPITAYKVRRPESRHRKRS